MSRYIIYTIALGALLLLPGCAGFWAAQQAAATDSYCISVRKIVWSVDDDPDTIKRAEVHNRTIDKRCGIPGRRA